MTSISNAQHQAFCKAIQEELSRIEGNTLLIDKSIEEHLQSMELLRMEYMQHLRTLQSLVIRYESARKETRILLRKCLAAQKRQMIKPAKNINPTISKAS